MGIIENSLRKRKRKENIQKAILTSVKTAGLLSLAILAPNSIRYLKSLGIIPGKRQKEIIYASKNRLINKGLLSNRSGFLELTKKGEAKLEFLEMTDWKIDKPRKWDKKWRMLVFDIPESRKSLRNKIRLTLMNIGFLRLQDSVWIYPHPCEDLVNLLKVDFRVGKDLLYIIADSIENDKKFRNNFNIQ
ncbi:MAG: hypothetical protein A3H52_01905 [Candidatus Zambryskibacteria bacterium RIFCSPLOWO2_02_FULL_39_26]|uniref:Transcriptional repressor PaaX-like central Cas2-like domain-containing protein n=1 Tax=Candidatus Zambryskibacteria bacterium RIFCSPLOWO2_12_FULL_39_23 TaxID=1802776 RepID=A0A1G2UR59_9BACT|nr:MAG: hypothetical protein A2W51_00250 [Candidatus Zambryskibacteria bacterium RIFCSPHIGHO2_02_39_10]OHB00229.1 MAG: hypothetical protein A3E59_01550 [Candidatus Zambryskibacteria bacterium RIFCSPHIGHO2_12_FULL_39_47]OHB10048.1 MAG: hypothetical protein A3H52_01905 [Candidatus Zambryskibacteria bacterium RIFCSPLOWO2_02_FULL_39_26]OHB11878.1 MAG: hypothetical protein A3G99_00965 [Candidatus Zambryskibacteria bacterium RIFCSPLOWO2_12_FULL_39_23]